MVFKIPNLESITQRRNKMKKIQIAFLVALFALALTGCAKNYDTKLSVDMTEFSFTPSEYSVPAGKEITLTLTNSGTVEHEFVIMKLGTEVSIPFDDNDEGNIYWEVEVEPGDGTTVTFTAPPDVGEYQIVCGTAGHAENNMIGKMTVVAP
jgi:uncharacterized cupredoxin-like copper-binding protein